MFVIDTPPPIIQPDVELWEARLSSWLMRQGISARKRADIICEVKRVAGCPIGNRRPQVLRPAIEDLAKYGGLVGANVVPGMTGAVAAAATGEEETRSPLSVTYCTRSYIGNSTAGSWAFNGKSIGTASSTRVLVVMAATSQHGSNTLSLTINGNAATKIFSDYNSGDAQADTLAAFALLVTSGTTADFVLSTSPNANCPMIVIYAVDAGDTALPTIEDYAVGYGNGSGPIALGLDVSAGGAIIAAGHGTSGSSFSGSWSVLTQDFSVYSYAGSFNAAHAEYASAGTYSPALSFSGQAMAAIGLAIR